MQPRMLPEPGSVPQFPCATERRMSPTPLMPWVEVRGFQLLLLPQFVHIPPLLWLRFPPT